VRSSAAAGSEPGVLVEFVVLELDFRALIGDVRGIGLERTRTLFVRRLVHLDLREIGWLQLGHVLRIRHSFNRRSRRESAAMGSVRQPRTCSSTVPSVGTYAVTGAASGIGRATAERLRGAGHRVIGVDLRGSDVEADLGTPDGRATAVAAIIRAAEGRLDGLVTAAGIGGSSTEQGGRLVAINYFGSVELVQGLRDALAASGSSAVVCIGSNSATVQPDWSIELAEACLSGDETRARELADTALSLFAYPASKAAVSWFVRTAAPKTEWIGAGIRLNVVAPGLTETALTAGQRRDPLIGDAIVNFPVPLGRPIDPDEIADVIAFVLASPVLVGSVVVADGGTEALLRPKDWPAVWRVSRP
jgi:NAD(P)-dependent dehydrogenase (short-subunit alcohol dehydrogenase family)